MRICLINGQLGPSLRDLGHEVLEVLPAPGVTDVRTALEPSGFRPDLLVQTEVLGARVILAGLEHLDCIKVFWSIDSHLNAFWHAHYGRLFDAVATTQPAWVHRLGALGLPQVFPLPWFGSIAPFKPFAARGHDVSFCGRIGPSRPLRRQFADFLHERFAARLEENLPYEQMLALFGDTRIVPNESIAGEINFRLFEAASHGSVVLNPRCEGLETLFEPGREVETYSNVLELDDRLRHWLARPAEMERMGLQARERVLACHLPVHRARELMRRVEDLKRTAAQGSTAALMFHLTLLDLLEAERLELSAQAVASGLLALQDMPEAAVGLMRLHYYFGDRAGLSSLLEGILAGERFAGNQEVEASASLAALALGKWDMARLFWHRHRRATGQPPALLEDPAGLARSWAAAWARTGREIRLGMVYDSSRHAPQSAFEALMLAHTLAPKDLALVRAVDSILGGYSGVEETRLALLSELSLHDRHNWRLGLRLGLVNLRAFRLREGLEELQLAHGCAAASGAEARFLAALEREDPTGAVRAALGVPPGAAGLSG
ncbi:CgeB family protein [Fundidesulfovibrio agrisoli]|uniref:CgeB family protein n=1 Tax=Fundidesulfovibrio agrisoli TaxID=2922717 RepID=UPI001FADEBAF|nr:glycosyltransferase [Fundidesulfovibrio agrisoli]